MKSLWSSHLDYPHAASRQDLSTYRVHARKIYAQTQLLLAYG
jgi:hypothetical protein